jgi:hypothetical protein
MIKPIKAKSSRSVLLLICFALFYCLSGCGGSKDEAATGTGTGTSTDTTTTAASINLSASSSTVKSDSTDSTTITVNALNSSNAAISGVTVTLSATTPLLGGGSVVTSTTTPATVTFSAGGIQTNRNVTITATAGAVSSQINIQVVGSTVGLTANPTNITIGSTSTLYVSVKDAGGHSPAIGTPVTLSSSGSGSVSIANITPYLGPLQGQTDNNGQITAVITGTSSGIVTVSAQALGATGTQDFSVGTTPSIFSIDDQILNGSDIGNPKPSAMKIGDNLVIEVNAPLPTTHVTFASVLGSWSGSSVNVAVDPGTRKATATLNTAQYGKDTVQVCNTSGLSPCDTLTVYMTSGYAANKILLQVTPTTVRKKVGDTADYAQLIATVYDSSGFPVSGAPVSFSILNSTGGGESISPAMAQTSSTAIGVVGVGQALSTFSSGTQSSVGAGVKIRASVLGTGVATGTGTSGPDQSIVIGGTAGSVAFGTVAQTGIMENGNKTQYILPMSVMVADSAGKPVAAGTTVSVTAWPVAFSTGTYCSVDDDDGISKGTFFAEDTNENLFLDPSEDGGPGVNGGLDMNGNACICTSTDCRVYYKGTLAGACATGTSTADGYLTPTNSAGGATSSNIVTDTYGVANFTLVYPKTSAFYIVTRLRASTIVQGSETVGQTTLRLPAMLGDVTYLPGGSIDKCYLPNSTFRF